jgi:MFS family permease
MVSEKQEKILIEKTKEISVKEASAYSFMDGFGLRYVTPYALAAGANNTQIGLLSSVPGLIGNLSQLLTIRLMKHFKRKQIIFWGVLLQAIMWLFLIAAGIPFFLMGIKTSFSPDAIIVIYTLLILVGAVSGPAWASMMRDLVSTNRGDYFGRRSRISGAIALVCMFVAGFILDYFKQTHIFIGFAILFFVSFLGRFVSSVLMRKHYDPKFKVDDKKYFSLLDFIKQMRHNNFGRFVLYFSLLSFACAIASPFFVVYYLKNLGFSYTQYMIAAIANSLATILLMPLWGKFADKYGNLKVMQISGFLIPFLPLFYLPIALMHSSSFVLFFIILIEIYSGVVWAGFNLAAGNFIYDAVSKERLAICSSYFNILNGFWALVGAMIGGYLSSHNVSIFGLTPILFLFLLSGIFRFAVHFVMSKKINEVREVEKFDIDKHFYSHLKRFAESTKRITKNVLGSVSLGRFFESLVSESEHLFSSNPNNFVKNN